MEYYRNGIKYTFRDMTPDEIAAMEEQEAMAAAKEKKRPLSLAEVQEMLLRQQVNTLAVDDAMAFRMRDFYPPWESNKAYTAANGCPVGFKVTRGGRLFKLRQEHTSMDGWEPGATGTESLWEEICESHDGSKYDPIPYNGNMALENGKFYSQSGAVYKCFRDTGNPVYHDLVDLVGLYLEVVE